MVYIYMIIDTKNKIIYISNPKTGSTTFRYIMNKYNDKKLIKKLIENKDYHPHYNYREWYSILSKYGINIDDYYCFTTIRNPFRRIISFYKYCNFDDNGIPFWKKKYNSIHNNNYSFKQFINEYPYHTSINWKWEHPDFIDFKNNKYNDIYKLEELNLDIINKKIKQHCNINNYFHNIPIKNKTHKTNTIYFTEHQMIDKIKNIFINDIIYGNYAIPKINEY